MYLEYFDSFFSCRDIVNILHHPLHCIHGKKAASPQARLISKEVHTLTIGGEELDLCWYTCTRIKTIRRHGKVKQLRLKTTPFFS